MRMELMKFMCTISNNKEVLYRITIFGGVKSDEKREATDAVEKIERGNVNRERVLFTLVVVVAFNLDLLGYMGGGSLCFPKSDVVATSMIF